MILTRATILGWQLNRAERRLDIRYRLERVDDSDGEVIRDVISDLRVRFADIPQALRDQLVATESTLRTYVVNQLKTAKDPNPTVTIA